jgi:RNA polymerase sigma factor (sigma-70 family)
LKPSNQELLNELRRGSRRGYTLLTKEYHGPLLREAVRKYGLPRQDAEELVNDVLMTVVSKSRQFVFKKSDDDFGSWIVTILRNRIRDHLRKAKLSLRPVEETVVAGTADSEHGIETDAIVSTLRGEETFVDLDREDHAGTMQQRLVEALECLKPWEQVLVRLRSLNVPYLDIARYTGKNAKYLKVHHARAMKKLKALIERSASGGEG